MSDRHPHYCGAPTSLDTQRYDPSGKCKRRVREEGQLCPYHARAFQRTADRHE